MSSEVDSAVFGNNPYDYVRYTAEDGDISITGSEVFLRVILALLKSSNLHIVGAKIYQPGNVRDSRLKLSAALIVPRELLESLTKHS